MSNRSSAWALIGDTVNFLLKLTIKTNQVKYLFLRRGETGVPGENLSVQSREPKNSTPYDAGSGNRTRATLVGGECSHHRAMEINKQIIGEFLFNSVFFFLIKPQFLQKLEGNKAELRRIRNQTFKTSKSLISLSGYRVTPAAWRSSSVVKFQKEKWKKKVRFQGPFLTRMDSFNEFAYLVTNT